MIERAHNIVVLSKNSFYYDSLIGNLWGIMPHTDTKNILEKPDSPEIIKSDGSSLECKINSRKLKLDWFNNIGQLNNLRIIDILIVDIEIPKHNIADSVIGDLINLTNSALDQDEIRLAKPIKIQQIFDIVNRSLHSNLLIAELDKDWVYSERNSNLHSAEHTISLTEKENQIIKQLSLNNNRLDFEHLKKNIWKNGESNDSNTLETHLYRLKNKLPKNMIKFDHDICYLNQQK